MRRGYLSKNMKDCGGHLYNIWRKINLGRVNTMYKDPAESNSRDSKGGQGDCITAYTGVWSRSGSGGRDDRKGQCLHKEKEIRCLSNIIHKNELLKFYM